MTPLSLVESIIAALYYQNFATVIEDFVKLFLDT